MCVKLVQTIGTKTLYDLSFSFGITVRHFIRQMNKNEGKETNEPKIFIYDER